MLWRSHNMTATKRSGWKTTPKSQSGRTAVQYARSGTRATSYAKEPGDSSTAPTPYTRPSSKLLRRRLEFEGMFSGLRPCHAGRQGRRATAYHLSRRQGDAAGGRMPKMLRPRSNAVARWPPVAAVRSGWLRARISACGEPGGPGRQRSGPHPQQGLNYSRIAHRTCQRKWSSPSPAR